MPPDEDDRVEKCCKTATMDDAQSAWLVIGELLLLLPHICSCCCSTSFEAAAMAACHLARLALLPSTCLALAILPLCFDSCNLTPV